MGKEFERGGFRVDQRIMTLNKQRLYAIGRLEESGRQNDEKMSCKTGNAEYHATFFRHSAVSSLPAVMLRIKGLDYWIIFDWNYSTQTRFIVHRVNAL